MILPADPEARKGAPICRGVLDYFPLAIAEIARLSLAATLQHHPDQPMHWDRDKSADHEDCLVRHLIERGTRDTDGQRHTAKAAWRALALLQLELEQASQEPEPDCTPRFRDGTPVQSLLSQPGKWPVYCGKCTSAYPEECAKECPYRDPKRMRLDHIDVV